MVKAVLLGFGPPFNLEESVQMTQRFFNWLSSSPSIVDLLTQFPLQLSDLRVDFLKSTNVFPAPAQEHFLECAPLNRCILFFM